MKEKIEEICNKLNREQLSVVGATAELLDLFSVSNRRELFDDFYKWLDGLTQAEYDDMSLTDKIEKHFFKN